MNIQRTIRKFHRWGALITALPFIIVALTGILLQLKKEVSWIQPPTQNGNGNNPTVTLMEVLDIVKRIPEADVHAWQDIDRLDVRPEHGIIKVRCKNRREIQLDAVTGEVLQTAYRRSDLIEDIHAGSWFHPRARLWIFLPSGIVVTLLWMTGMYLLIQSGRLSRSKRDAISKKNRETG
jgi:uncharacterized iron-regulated membrane protein